jgi:hypothetical protein
MIYPVWETVFSMIRRGSEGGLHRMGQPDALHLHQLIYRRLMKRFVGSPNPQHRILRNSLTSVYLWALALMSIVPAVLFWNRPSVLMAFAGLFIVSYGVLYAGIVRFRVPRWLVAAPLDSARTLRKEQQPTAAVAATP